MPWEVVMRSGEGEDAEGWSSTIGQVVSLPTTLVGSDCLWLWRIGYDSPGHIKLELASNRFEFQTPALNTIDRLRVLGEPWSRFRCGLRIIGTSKVIEYE